ncbi:MAG: Phosphoserine phosphatase RsbU [Chlamydiae bacterium]|nr:Phosphoserine phosphatase RsbU [Chlamydiota bacterium]
MAKKTFYGSLARRIVLILLVFLGIPILIYAGLLWNHDWKIKQNAARVELEVLGKSQLKAIEEWMALRSCELINFSILAKDETDLSKRFEEMRGFSTIFVFDRDLRCLDSNKKELIGKENFFPEKLKKAFDSRVLSFIAENPLTKNKEIFLLKKVQEQIWGLSENENALGMTFVESSKKSKPGKDLVLQRAIPHAEFDLQVTIPTADIAQFEGGKFFHHLILFMALILLVGGGIAWWLVRQMARPLRQLSDVMDGVGAKDYDRRYQSSRFGFEINALGTQFNQMLETLLFNMEKAKELQVGQDLQKELLPKTIPQFPGIALGSGFLPAKEVAGDFYDLFVTDPDHLLIVIADGSDKGISACLYSLMVRSMLRSHALAEEDLGVVMRLTNDLFCRDTGDTGNFVTAWVGIYHRKDRKLTYSSAGHFPAILIHEDGTIEELAAEGIAFGVQESASFDIQSKILSPDSLLFLYTDGVTEAHNEKGELFAKSRLLEFLLASHALEPQALIDKLIAEIERFGGESPMHDDLTVLSLKRIN